MDPPFVTLHQHFNPGGSARLGVRGTPRGRVVLISAEGAVRSDSVRSELDTAQTRICCTTIATRPSFITDFHCGFDPSATHACDSNNHIVADNFVSRLVYFVNRPRRSRRNDYVGARGGNVTSVLKRHIPRLRRHYVNR